jgi:hypothetical protein
LRLLELRLLRLLHLLLLNGSSINLLHQRILRTMTEQAKERRDRQAHTSERVIVVVAAVLFSLPLSPL